MTGLVSESPYAALLLVHCAATGFMVGVIWFVQVVHYPLFDRVGDEGFGDYSVAHQRRTAWVVIPPMLIEVATALGLLVTAPRSERQLVWWLVALLAGVWLSTFLLQVPSHRRLTRGFDRAAIRRLVGSNAIRTTLWTAKGALCLWLMARWLVFGS